MPPPQCAPPDTDCTRCPLHLASTTFDNRATASLGRADRVHDALAQHIRQRAAEALQQAERQQVHAHVVVLVVRAGGLQLAALALAAVVGADADLAVVIDLVRLAPQLALPLARLVQQMAPGDAGIVRARKPRALDAGADRLVDAGDETIGDGEAGQYGQVALGDGEGHIGPRRVAPFGNDAAASEDQAGRAATRNHGSYDLAPRPRLVPFDDADVAPVRIVEAARPGAVAGLGEGDRGLHLRGIEARVGGGDAPPSRPIRDIGIAAIRSVGHPAHLIEGSTRIGSTRAPAQKSAIVGGDKA